LILEKDIRMKLISKCFVGLFLFLPVLGFANAKIPASGLYVEFNAGQSRGEDLDFPSGYSVTKAGAGFNVNVGYRFIPYLSAEFGYTAYANAKGTQDPDDKLTIMYDSQDLAVKGVWPFESGVGLFAKLGVSRVGARASGEGTTAAEIKKSDSTFGTYYGVGAQYHLTSRAAIVAQYAKAIGNNSTGNLSLISLGLSVTFGGEVPESL
jgi:hypothetical protein